MRVCCSSVISEVLCELSVRAAETKVRTKRRNSERETDEGVGLMKILFWVDFVFDIMRKKSVKGVDLWLFMLDGFSQFSSCHLSNFNDKIP